MKRALVSMILCLSLGCSLSAREAAQVATTAAAQAVHATDLTLAGHYTENAAQALEEASSLEEYADSMEGWDTVEDAMRKTRASLYAMQSVLNVWEGTNRDPGFAAFAACFAAEARELLAVVREFAPEFDMSALQAVIGLVDNGGSKACHE